MIKLTLVFLLVAALCLLQLGDQQFSLKQLRLNHSVWTRQCRNVSSHRYSLSSCVSRSMAGSAALSIRSAARKATAAGPSKAENATLTRTQFNKCISSEIVIADCT